MDTVYNPKIVGKLHLTLRGRLIISLLAVGVLVAIVAALMVRQPAPTAVAADMYADETYQQIMVAPGDTLWEIAARLASAADQDHQVILDKIVVYNGLDSSALHVGQILYLPVID